MTMAELVREYERRRLEAERHGASAPLASVYSVVLDDLRSLDGVGTPDRLMSTVEAAKMLGVARKTVASWALEGCFPNARKTSGESGEWRIPARDVYAVLGQSETASSHPPRLWRPDE